MSLSDTALPFDDIRNLIRSLPGPDEEAIKAVQARDAQLTKPAGALGKLEDLAEWLAAWSGKPSPTVTRPLVAIFATAHGVADKGVSAFPSEVNRQMVENFAAGGAAINQICRINDIGLKVFDLAVDIPTPSITEEDALDEANCAATMAYGMEALAGGIDLICLGEMGIGNTTVAAAVLNALFGGSADEWIGRGTGVDDEGLARKRAAVEAAVARLGSEKDPLEILRRTGGREIAAMAGLIIAARLQRVPVIVDGFVTTAAAAVVYALDPDGLDHCVFSHVSAEAGHKTALAKMGKTALFDFGMRLGEGTGAALAAGIVKAAAETHTGMATFADAGVSGKEA
ncbi:nicotinate-nucleotide-dimethylbenzimidazole phosphoribosyltransferase [Roseibium hamelinense]|uniref:Nicotinate-nucleotide--dimethylbenzimidazole phosphoribosyltransferase n=1 Tax=Roseibium hamelinense TaxID=150831 RepID=A0A562T8G4_9HYPH|nr:nicotinate-nucleotide--dimethylbenzimidazole phosphoribosyltransferase [Roseibium hamelinense]MTI42059.1 nicotinate-nucleotide--dimethylbenzimidazole phosphoribosyltransferase [Roseibium hamelinense]TWI89518.1 nicotinate-nucleotide-dimethylbenzimidazole phosphoribosyltransferase [Roseibium hamelinense]